MNTSLCNEHLFQLDRAGQRGYISNISIPKRRAMHRKRIIYPSASPFHNLLLSIHTSSPTSPHLLSSHSRRHSLRNSELLRSNNLADRQPCVCCRRRCCRRCRSRGRYRHNRQSTRAITSALALSSWRWSWRSCRWRRSRLRSRWRRSWRGGRCSDENRCGRCTGRRLGGRRDCRRCRLVLRLRLRLGLLRYRCRVSRCGRRPNNVPIAVDRHESRGWTAECR
jgi:hypothetical protein